MNQKLFSVDLAPFGIRTAGTSEYLRLDLPGRVKPIGRTGKNHAYYGFLWGYGDMVFLFRPFAAPAKRILPVAQTFAGFLRLLLAFGHSAQLEEAVETGGRKAVPSSPSCPEQRHAQAELQEKTGLSPLEEPLSHIRRLWETFDASGLGAYEESPQAEKVCFSGNLWGHSRREHAGKELPLQAEFHWGNRRWIIPAVFSCAKGLVIRYAIQIPADEILGFLQKWNLPLREDTSLAFRREKQMQLELENPLSFGFHSTVSINGRSRRSTHGSSACWFPYSLDDIPYEPKIRQILERYHLDLSSGWILCQNAYPWPGKRPPAAPSIAVTLSQDVRQIPGPHFQVSGPGSAFSFCYPPTGETHTLTVQEYEPQKLEGIGMPQWEFPSHLVSMRYTISPGLPSDALEIRDCAESDQPRTSRTDPFAPTATNDCAAIGIIGGADGPTSVLVGHAAGEERIACSSLHFQPAESVEWQILFDEKPFSDYTVSLR